MKSVNIPSATPCEDIVLIRFFFLFAACDANTFSFIGATARRTGGFIQICIQAHEIKIR